MASNRSCFLSSPCLPHSWMPRARKEDSPTLATLFSVFSAVPRQLRVGKSLMTLASKSESIDPKQRKRIQPPPRQQSTSTSTSTSSSSQLKQTAEHTFPHTRCTSLYSCTPFLQLETLYFGISWPRCKKHKRKHLFDSPRTHAPLPLTPPSLRTPLGRVRV